MAKAEKVIFPRALWILYAGTFINRFGGFVGVFLVLYMTSRGYTSIQAGIAVSSYGIGSIVSSLLGGYCADLLGRRNTILLSMFSSATAMLLLSQASTLPLIVLLTGLAGLTTELYRPASSALVTDLVPAEGRVTAFASYRFAINLGTGVGPVVAGLLASRSFLLIFVGDALTSICFGLLALFGLPTDSGRYAIHGQEQGSFLKALRADHRFLFFLLASLGITFVYFQCISTFPLQIHVLGLSNALYGILISLNGLVIILLELPLSTLTKRFPARPVIALGWLLTGLGFGLNALAHTIPLLALTVVIWTFGEMIESPVSSAYIANIAPAHLRGRYQGLWGLVWSSGLILGPLLGAALFSWNPQGLWLICAILGVAAALLLIATGRRQPTGTS